MLYAYGQKAGDISGKGHSLFSDVQLDVTSL